ncbi:hypothetical protein L345_17974, partial [Ophiophagus hannah]
MSSLCASPYSPPPKGRETHFLFQRKAECCFVNGTQRVRFLDRNIYDQQEFLHFDSDLGKFVAVTEFGKVDADKLNGDKQWLQIMRAQVDRFCRHNYEAFNFREAKREERIICRR